MRRLLPVGLALLLVACGGDDSPTMPRMAEVCSGFPDWETSSFVLPYAVGSSYFLDQANCSGGGHSGFWKYGYDFLMEIGTPIHATRGGTVVYTEGDVEDGDRNGTNLIVVQHGDGTVALYSHLTRGGALVSVGDRIRRGQLIGLSGDTGNTGGTPHLHFSLHPCDSLPGLPGNDHCPSLPMTILNTEPNPNGLVAKRFYAALPY